MKFSCSIIVALLSSFLLSSCFKKVKNQPDLGSDRLFIVSQLSPQDTLIVVKVYKLLAANTTYTHTYSYDYTNYYPDADSNEIEVNATVIISDGSFSTNLFYNPKYLAYTVDASVLNPSPGKTYYLEVSAPGKKTATANCKIPNPVTDFYATLDSVDESSIVNGYKYFIRSRWKDIPGEENFYMAGLYDKYYYYLNVSDSTLSGGSGFSYEPENKNLVTDQYLDGATINHTSSLIYDYEFRTDSYSDFTVYATIQVVDKNYVEYDKWQRSLDLNNPFSQPSLLFTNVQNGLGIFTGINKTSYLIKRNR